MSDENHDKPLFTLCLNLCVLGILFHIVLIIRGLPHVTGMMLGILLWQAFPYGIGLLLGFLMKRTAIPLGGILAMLCVDVAVYIRAFTDPYDAFYPTGGGGILLGMPFGLLIVVLPAGMVCGWGVPKIVTWHRQALSKGNWRGRVRVALWWLFCVICVLAVRAQTDSAFFQRSKRGTTRFHVGKVFGAKIGAYNVDYGHFLVYTGPVHGDMFLPLSWDDLELPKTAGKDAWGTPLYYIVSAEFLF